MNDSKELNDTVDVVKYILSLDIDHDEMVNYIERCTDKYLCDPIHDTPTLQWTVDIGDINLIKYFGKITWNSCAIEEAMKSAYITGRLDFLEHFAYLKKDDGSMNWKLAMQTAISTNILDLVKYCEEKEVQNYGENFLFSLKHSKRINYNIIKYFRKKIDPDTFDWNKNFIEGCRHTNNRINFDKHMVDKIDWTDVVVCNSDHGRYFICKIKPSSLKGNLKIDFLMKEDCP